MEEQANYLKQKSVDPNEPIDPADVERVFQDSRLDNIIPESGNAEVHIRFGGETIHLFDINIQGLISIIRKFS